MHEEKQAETLGAEQEFEEVRLYNNTVVLRFDPKIHAYYVDGESGTRFRVASVTEVLGIIHKPALVQWSATAATEYLRAKIHPQFVASWANPDKSFTDGYMVPAVDFERFLSEARLHFRTISKTATDIGTIAHEWLEVHLKSLIAGGGGMPPLPDNEKAQNCIKAALEWFDRHKFRPVSSERRIYSRKYIYCGTKDWDGYITGCGDPACCPFEGERFVLGDFKSSKNIYQEYRVQLAAYRHASEEEFPDAKYAACVVMRLDKEGNGVETLTIMPEDFEDDFDAFLGAQAMYNWEKQIDLDNRMKKAALRPPRTKRKPPKKVVIKDAFVPVPVAA